uniref:SERPIN domain-containing protein n=1 Tax=Caenorhabditis tropicalis TaxID=1561998 RepID=A0A1I7TAP9_9PELO
MLDFVCANQSLNERLIAEGTGFRAAGNSYFKILEIPLNEESLRMMIFLPKGGYSLEESLKVTHWNFFDIKTLLDLGRFYDKITD